MRILGVCGSLRAGSSNRLLLEAAGRVLPGGVEFVLFDGVGLLPHFNPDLDVGTLPEAVVFWRREVSLASAILISTPEYAHGIPGVLKNALDWLVSGIEISHKPVGLIYGSAGDAGFAEASLKEILRTMSARVIDRAVVHVSGVRKKTGGASGALDLDVSLQIEQGLRFLLEEAKAAGQS